MWEEIKPIILLVAAAILFVMLAIYERDKDKNE